MSYISKASKYNFQPISITFLEKNRKIRNKKIQDLICERAN